MDTFDLVAAERIRLADALEQLAPDDWDAPSLCQGWTVHQVAAHLNAPWSVSIPSMALTIARSFGFDRGIDRVARDLAGRLDPAACVAGLRDHADSRFTPPGAGPEAPLTDVLVDGGDTLRPFGRSAVRSTAHLRRGPRCRAGWPPAVQRGSSPGARCRAGARGHRRRVRRRARAGGGTGSGPGPQWCAVWTDGMARRPVGPRTRRPRRAALTGRRRADDAVRESADGPTSRWSDRTTG